MMVKWLLSLGFAVFTAFLAQATTEHRHCVCGTVGCTADGHEHSDVEWTAWTATDSLPTTAGHWYLGGDVTLTNAWTPVDGTYLCLNGHVVRQTAEGEKIISVSEYTDYKTIVLTDCNRDKTRYFTDADGDGCYETMTDTVDETSRSNALEVVGGVLTGSHVGAISLMQLRLEMYGGNIVGNRNTGSTERGESQGGAIEMRSASLNMYGGRICGNAATWGGGIYAGDEYDDVSMNALQGGLIDHNTATYGGGLYFDDAILTMDGGIVTANRAEYGGGVMCANATWPRFLDCAISNNVCTVQGGGVYEEGNCDVTVGGTVVIAGNMRQVDGEEPAADNVYLTDQYGTGSGLSLDSEVSLADGASVGIALAYGPDIEENGGIRSFILPTEESYVWAFFSDNPEFYVDYDYCYSWSSEKEHVLRIKPHVNFYAADDGSDPVLVITNVVMGGTFVFPEPPTGMTRSGFDFTGWQAEYDWEMKHYDVNDESPELQDVEWKVYADWRLCIIQQPNVTNDYTVLVAATNEVEYQWFRWDADMEDWDYVPYMATNSLVAGFHGQTYRCRLRYDNLEKSVYSDSVVWEEPDTLVEVRPVAGANATVAAVYTNDVAIVPVGGKYYVFYGEEVGVNFAANDGYLFPTALDWESPVFAATEDPTVVRSASAHQPHKCHDMNLVVPIGDIKTFYLVCSNSYSGYLTTDLTVDHDIALGLVQLTAPQICLNGHVLDLNGHAFLETGMPTCFCDCQHAVARHYEADNAGLWHLVETPSSTSHSLYGGVIIGGSAGESLGVFDNRVMLLTFLDVNVVGNDGGEGAVVYSSCKTRFIGGALCGNRADKGVLYEAQEGDCWCRVGGRVRISDNVSTEDKPCNLFVREGGTISIDPDVPLATDASIGVTAEYGPITGKLPDDYSPCFTPDHDGDVITNRADNQLFLLGPAATVTFDANGGEKAPATITTLRVGDVMSVPGPGEMTRAGYAFAGWKLNGNLKAAGDEIAIEEKELTFVADWTLVIAQQPTYANGYVVGVGTTDEIGYQWYGMTVTSFAESELSISYNWGTTYDETDDALHQGGWGDIDLEFDAAYDGSAFTFASDRDDLDQLVSDLAVTGKSGDLTTYEWIVKDDESLRFSLYSYETVTLYHPCLTVKAPIAGQDGTRLTEGTAGEKYFCRLTYAGGEKTIDTNEALWYEAHDPVTVTTDAGINTQLVGVYTNGVKLIEEDDHYVVTYSEVVVAVYQTKAGYVFPDGSTVFTNAVMALDDPTVIAGEKGYLPHVHCLCGDGACAVPGHAHEDLTWRPWTATDALPTESGNWYLTEDVMLNAQATLGAVNIRLCLNGHAVRQGSESEEGQAIVRTDNANCRFALTDCADAATPGRLTEGSNRAVVVGDGVFEFWRGSLVGNTSDGDGGAVLVYRGYGARFRMYGGTICGNHSSYGCGGGVYVDAETHAEFYGGVITNNVADNQGGGVACRSWGEPYVADVTIGGALVVTDNEGRGKTDNLNCLGGVIAFSADVPLTDAARVGISYTSGAAQISTQAFAKAFGADCTAHLFADDPFAYVAYNEEQQHELRTRVLVQPSAANGYTFELYTNGLEAGAVTYQWNTNAVSEAYLTEADLVYSWTGTWDGEVCTAYDDDGWYNVSFKTEQKVVVLEFETEIPSDLEFSNGTITPVPGQNAIRVTFSEEDDRDVYCWSSESTFSFKVKAVETVNIPQEGETSAGLVTREAGTYFCRATIDGQTRDSDEATVAGFVPAASVTGNGATTYYATLEEAWTNAVSSEYNMTNVLVRMLKDATVTETLSRKVVGFTGLTFTLDLNDHVLAYAGESDACVVEQSGGMAMQIVDTAAKHTPRYFTCDEETGVWTLTNEVTALSVSGGLITGGRAGAVKISYGPQTNVIRNVNLVGNRNDWNDGGAVSVMAGTLDIFNSTFLGNVSAKNGGAISSGVPCLMTDCRVEANVAGGLGGGVYLKRCGSLIRTEVVGNRAGTGGGAYLTFQTSSCFPAGTQILMADGTEKTIESVVEGDVVRTFDHVGGTNSSAAVFYVYRGERARDVFALSFASGTTLEIVDRHDLLLETTRKYVTVSSDNARSYLGKRFYNYMTGGWDELTDVTQAKDGDACYSLYTRGHGNCVANGMLTVPDDKDCFVNIYELDGNLKADAERLAADIATYGLAEPADYPNIPLDDFEDGNIRYAFVAIGKGLTTQEELLFWNEYDYGPVVAKKAASSPRLLKGALKFATATPIPSPSEPYLRVGEDVVVTGNVSAAEMTDNVYLKPSVSMFGTAYNPVIDILPDATGVNVGVTLSSGAGVFGWTNAVNYADSFFADDPTFSVSYTADGELALRAGIQVGGDAWATVDADGVCTIIGTGDTWNTRPLLDYRAQIRDVVVEDGVTSVGRAFLYKFYAVTNVSLAASVTNVSDHAFYNCHSLERLSFAGATPTLGEQAIMFSAAIRMEGEMPVVYTIPDVSGANPTYYGKKALTDAAWTDVTGLSDAERREYHFFKVVVE